VKPQYTEEEANAILRRAIEDMPAGHSVSLEQLGKIAAEIGIPPDSLQQAAAEHAAAGGSHRKYATFLAHETAIFRNHLYSFTAAAVLVCLLIQFTGREYWWLYLPLFGWSLALLCHAAKVYDRDSQHHVNSFIRYLYATRRLDSRGNQSQKVKRSIES
jgi:hypothetical protein